MNFTYLILVALGLGMLAWGLPASYRLPRPWHILAALCALAGAVATMLGTLLVTVPNFFKS